MQPWDAKEDWQKRIEKLARVLMAADGTSTKPDDILVFFDPFRWDGSLSTPAGAHTFSEIESRRPAWTAPRWVKMANAAIATLLN